MEAKDGKKKKNPKNKLDDFEFCLKKAIAIHVFSNRNGGTMTEFAKAIGTNQSMISKFINRVVDEEGRITSILDSRHAPNMKEIFRAAVYLHISFLDMIDKAIEGEATNPLLSDEKIEEMKRLSKELRLLQKKETDTPNRLENRTQDYLKKIYRTGNAKYVGFYLQDDKIEHMIIETYEPYETGSVPFTARIIGKAGNAYRGNIVSPPGNDHLFFYIRQEDSKNDRGLMIFYIDDDIQEKYKCGSGVLLSTDRKSRFIKLQWVIITRIESRKHNKKIDTMQMLQDIQNHAQTINAKDSKIENSEEIESLDMLFKPLLEENLPKAQVNQVLFETLSERQRTLFDIYNKRNTAIAIAEERLKIAEAEYQKALKALEEIKESQAATNISD